MIYKRGDSTRRVKSINPGKSRPSKKAKKERQALRTESDANLIRAFREENPDKFVTFEDEVGSPPPFPRKGGKDLSSRHKKLEFLGDEEYHYGGGGSDRGYNEDDEENDHSSPKSKFPSMSGNNFTAMMVAGVAVVAAGLYYFRGRLFGSGSESSKIENEDVIGSGDQTQGKNVRWADQEGQQLEDQARAQEFQAQEQRMQMANRLEEILHAMKLRRVEVEECTKQEKQVAEQQAPTFTEQGASYDDDLTNMESEQSFETAFMTKDALDKKRDGIREFAVALQNKRERALGELQQHTAEYQHLDAIYKQSFGSPYISKEVMAQRRQQQQPPPRY